MASYIKTLKEDNGDITYPQTLGSAVLLTGGADLETELAGKASASSVAGKIDIGDVQSSDIVSNAVTTAKINDSAVTTAKLNDGAVTNAKIANSTISQTKINWSTMTTTFTANTDGAGFMEVPTNVVKPATGFILGARKHALTGASSDDAMFVPFTNWAADRYTLKAMFFNLDPVANTSIEVDIVYCLA